MTCAGSWRRHCEPGDAIPLCVARPPLGRPADHHAARYPLLLALRGPTLRILGYDVETQAAFVRTYDLGGRGGLHVPIQHVEQDSKMACFVAQFKGEKKIHFRSDWADGQAGMAKALHELFEEADVVLSYNGKSFDDQWARTLFQQNGLGPWKPFHHVDLYQETKKFRLLSHKLAWVSTHLGIETEGKFSITLMRDIDAAIDGDTRAQARVKRYNRQDVALLFQLYDGLLPWLKLPNARLYGAPLDACPRCGSTDYQKRGFRYTGVSKFQQYQCQNKSCGGWFSDSTRLQGAGGVAV